VQLPKIFQFDREIADWQEGQAAIMFRQRQHYHNQQQQNAQQKQSSEADRHMIQALADDLMQQASDAQKQRMMQNVANRLHPQRLAQMRAEGQNPLAMLFLQEATKKFMLARRNEMEKQMPSNTPGIRLNTPGIQLPPILHHLGAQQWNPKMKNNIGRVQSRGTTLSPQYLTNTTTQAPSVGDDKVLQQPEGLDSAIPRFQSPAEDLVLFDEPKTTKSFPPGIYDYEEQEPAIQSMLAELNPQQRQMFLQLPEDRIKELYAKWKRTGLLSAA
jgi:hypothetical protein